MRIVGRSFRRVVVLVALAACSACAASRSPQSPSPAVEVRRVVVLGDSLAVSPTLPESFPAQLQARIVRERRPWTVTNAGVFGDTTADGLRRIDSVFASDVGVLVVELGANDGIQGVNLETVERNLTALVAAGQQRNVRVLLCGMETLPVRGLDYTIGFHLIFPRVAGARDVPLVPFLLAGVALVPELNGPDGVHPNALGAQRIADTVWPYLEPLLRP